MKKKDVCFIFLKVSRKIIDNILNMKIIMYIVYRCLQNDEKIFKTSKSETRNDILKFYKNFALLSYFSIEFNAELFNFNRYFSMTIKTSTFSAIENVIIDHQI